MKTVLTPVFLLLLVFPPVSFGKNIHVDSTAMAGGDGTTWGRAFTKVQDGLAVAVPKDTVKVAGGVYYPDEGTGVTPNSAGETFQIPNEVALLGGYKPGDVSGSRDIQVHLTILSGDIVQDDVNTDGNDIAESTSQLSGTNSTHVVTVSGTTGTTVLEGFVITAGRDTAGSGGGVLVTNGQVEIRHCWFAGNRCAGRGGALYVNNADAEVISARFTGNSADARGGAVGTASSGDCNFTNCAFSGNASDRGGAANINNSLATMTNCTFSGNSGAINGGAIQGASNATIAVNDSIIWRNHAAGIRNGAGSSINLISGASADVSDNSIVENVSGPNPEFVTELDPAAAPSSGGNFRLEAGSPAVNAGDPGGNGTPLDLDFNPRLQSIAIDLGAYEYVPVLYYVDVGAFGTGSGLSWANAFVVLQSAMAAAEAADQIHIANGVYTPATSTDSFDLRRDVSLFGGYPPGGGATRDPVANPVILSGDVGLDDINSDGNSIAETTADLVGTNCLTVLQAAPGHALSAGNVIDGLIFTAGQALSAVGGDSPNSQGGAVYLGNDYPEFRDCVFSGNESRNGGGAVFLFGGSGALLPANSPLFKGCSFTGNLTLSAGGAVQLEGGRPVFQDCLFEENTAVSGAAVELSGSGGVTEFRETSFLGNSVSSGPSGGTILVNHIGGGTDFINCLVAGNDGFGIVTTAATNLRSCTVTGNKGGPAFKSGGSFNVWNTIFWGNELLFSSDGSGSLEEFHHSLIEGFAADAWSPFSSRGNLDGTDAGNDPDFISPQPFSSAPTVGGDYRLMLSSPVISGGDNAETPLLLDLAGNPRLSGHTIDMGCYEVQLPDMDGDGLSDNYEFLHTSPPSFTALDPYSNTDGDVYLAIEEFAYGGNPNLNEGTNSLVRFGVRRLGTFQIALVWTPNPNAAHYVRIVPEHSLDMDLTDPWRQFEARAATATFGGMPGDFMALSQDFLPLQETQFLRLRVVK